MDSNSNDGTQNLVKNYALKHKEIKLFSYDNTRGKSRNYGVKNSKGEVIAFKEGNSVADPNWLKEISQKISEGFDIVAGKTIRSGLSGFK
ncbi:MAG: glycosyltransferase, partial [Thermoplasmatales archaeon]